MAQDAFPNNDDVSKLLIKDEAWALAWLNKNAELAKQYVQSAQAAVAQDVSNEFFRHTIANVLKLSALATKSKLPRAEAWDKYFQYTVPNTVQQVFAHEPGSADQDFAKALVLGVYRDCMRSIELVSVIGFIESDKQSAYKVNPLVTQQQLHRAELARVLDMTAEAKAGLKSATSKIASVVDPSSELELSLIMERVAQASSMLGKEQIRELDACLYAFDLWQQKTPVVTPERSQIAQKILGKYEAQISADSLSAALIRHLLSQLQKVQHQSAHLNRSMKLPVKVKGKRRPKQKKQQGLQSFEPGAGSMGRYKLNKQDPNYFDWD